MAVGAASAEATATASSASSSSSVFASHATAALVFLADSPSALLSTLCSPLLQHIFNQTLYHRSSAAAVSRKGSPIVHSQQQAKVNSRATNCYNFELNPFSPPHNSHRPVSAVYAAPFFSFIPLPWKHTRISASFVQCLDAKPPGCCTPLSVAP